jgi:hypothetical protein
MGTTYKNGKTYQMTTKCSQKWLKEYQNAWNIPKIIHFKAYENVPNLGFLI